MNKFTKGIPNRPKLTDHSVMVVELSNSLPPVFKEKKEGGLVLYGEDPQKPYPDYLIDLYKRSTKHNAIINAKVRYTSSAGWSIVKEGKTAQQIAEYNRLIYKANESGETLNDITEKVNLDLEIFDGFAFEAIWDNKGIKVAEYYHVDFALIRVGKWVDKEGNEMIKYYYLPDWTGITNIEVAKTKHGFKEYEMFGTKGKGSELVYYKGSRPVKSGESDVYPIPYYVGAIPYIECDYEIANYNLSGVKNGFLGGTVITFLNGQPAEDQQGVIENKIKNKFTGTGNNRKVIINFADSIDQAPKIDHLTPPDWVTIYANLNTQVREEIFTTHNITNPQLFGIAQAGTIGGNANVAADYDLFVSNYVQAKQRILERVFNGFFRAMDMNPNLKLNRLTLEDDNVANQTLSVLNGLSPEIKNRILDNMSVDEIRGLIKMPSTNNVQMSTQNNIENRFIWGLANSGVSFEDVEVLHTSKVELSEANEPANDIVYLSQYFEKVFDFNFTDDEAKVLSTLIDNPKVMPEAIAEALDMDVDQVNKILDRFFAENIIKGEIGKSLDISKNGTKIIDEAEPTLKISIKYKYTAGEGQKDIIPTTREFCRDIINMKKLWTRAEIDALKNEDGTSAWRFRGGFYYNPKTDETTPFCRHFWEAVTVKERRNK